MRSEVDLKRRFLLAASAGLLAPRLAWTEVHEDAALYWKLEDGGDTARESIGGSQDAISSRTGHAMWVGEGPNRSLRLDGYSTWIEHGIERGIQSPLLHGDAVTISLWVALESYPVNQAALVELESASNAGCRLSIDKWGFVHFEMRSGGGTNSFKSEEPVAKGKWIHLAASTGNSGAILYRDGDAWNHVATDGIKWEPGEGGHVLLGKSSDCPLVAREFPTGVLNGLLRDVRVYEAQLSAAAISAGVSGSKPAGAPDLQINGSWCIADPQRPLYHAQPPRAWTNEPHGLIHWRGRYHLFYQKNPNGPYWGHIHWGHMTSPDLLRWTEEPVALWPEPGPDSEGCWSGSVIDFNGKLAILYTSGNAGKAGISLALSEDGINFSKHRGNPVIPVPPQGQGFPEFRDPFVWKEGEGYYLIIGSAVKDAGGTALLYKSKDLVTWKYLHPLLVGDKQTSGVFWEMPVFVKAGDHHALVVCEVPGRASYWVGSWKDEKFTPLDLAPRRLELFNHLLSPTPMTREDGQVVVMGIIPDERSPKETWAAGWAHLYSLPRSLSTNASGLLMQTPLEIIHQLSEPTVSISHIELHEGAVQELEGIGERNAHIRATFRRGNSHSVSLLVRRAAGGHEQTEIVYEWGSGRLILDRALSSLDPMVRRDRQETVYFPPDKDSFHISAFADNSVLEVFIDNQYSFATRIYPTLDSSNGIAFASTGSGARVENISVARLRRPA